MKNSTQQLLIVIFFLLIGWLFIPLSVSLFIFWELTFGIGGTIAVAQTENKEKKAKVKPT